MSEYNDIAGSDEVISLNYDTQDTLNEHSYRNKQSAHRFEKNLENKDQAKENQKPVEQTTNEENDDNMQTDTQNYTLSTVNNQVTSEEPPPTDDTQNNLTSTNPFVIRPPVAQSTLTDESSISVEKDLLPEKSPNPEEQNSVIDTTSKLKLDTNTSGLDLPTTSNDIRLYVSPSTSLLEAPSIDDAQPNPDNISGEELDGKKSDIEINDKPKEEPMDTADAQVSLGSDGMIESHPTCALIIESTSAIEKSTKMQSPTQSKISISPNSKTLYSLSQPTTTKFEKILAQLTASPSKQTSPTMINKTDSNLTIREEEELFIKESISKVVRRYAVKIDQNGRTVSRDLLNERVIEENTTTRIESWPPSEKKARRSAVKPVRPVENTRKKPTKATSPKRKTKSLKPTSNITSPKTSKAVQSDNEETSKKKIDEESSNDEADNDNDDDEPTDNLNGDEFIPPASNTTSQSLTKGLRVFAKWVDGRYYPGIIGSIAKGERYMIDFDDGGKRYVKANDIICKSYLDANQDIMAQTHNGYFQRGIVKRLIKKKKNGHLGYVVEKDGKEKWYPLRFISLTHEQAEHLLTIQQSNTTEETINPSQGKRKRTSNVPQTPNKKTKSSIFVSPNKSQRTTYTPTRQTKLFNTMYFLLSGFNDLLEVRHEMQESIESHGGRVIEKMPNANRRDNVYLITDKARKTAKFLEAKKLNIPCVDYKWINESIEKGEVQDWEVHKLVLPEKETKKTANTIADDDED